MTFTTVITLIISQSGLFWMFDGGIIQRQYLVSSLLEVKFSLSMRAFASLDWWSINGLQLWLACHGAGLSLWGSLSVGMKSVSAQVGWWGAVHTIPSSAPLSANENWPSDLFSSFLRQWTWQRSWNSICKSLLTMSNRAHERHGLHDANWIMGLRLTLRRLHQSASAWAIPVTRATDLF